MRTLSQFNEAKEASKLKIQENSINYISSAQLKKYLEIAKAFLSDDTKNIINYLIDNNASYISELSTDSDENALVGFYNTGVADTQEKKDLKQWIKNVIDSGRILEIPVFLTQEQFNQILSKKISPDEVILDLKSEKGRNEVVKRYTPLIHKICKQYNGKSNVQYDDLLGWAYLGMTTAMNQYGKVRSNKSSEEAEAIKSYTFGQYAAYIIRNTILDNIKETAHLVRIPVSQQRKEKVTTGKNVKNHSISGDKPVGHDDEGNKSIFDFIADTSDPSSNLDREDVEKLWKEIFDDLEDHFDNKVMDIFYSFYGLNGYKKVQNKILAKKYNVKPSQITYYCFKVREYILSNKDLKDKIIDVYELMKECQNDDDNKNSMNEPLYINPNENTSLPE